MRIFVKYGRRSRYFVIAVVVVVVVAFSSFHLFTCLLFRGVTFNFSRYPFFHISILSAFSYLLGIFFSRCYLILMKTTLRMLTT